MMKPNLYTYETVHRQQTALKPCTSIWQWLLLGLMLLRGQKPKKQGVRRGKPGRAWVVINPEAALNLMLEKGYNSIRIFDGKWCVAV